MPVTVSRGCWIAVRGLIFRQEEWYRKAFTPCLFRWRETGRFFMSGFHTRSVHEIQILTKEKGCEQKMDVTKYSVGYYPAPGEHFKWAHKDHIEKAPQWCSVDLRDGNQSLVIPMSLEEKLEFYKMLLKIGFKEIEVGFPAASETEYTFLRTLIEQNMIPQDVTVQVLTQCREHIIRKTFEACKGAPSAIIHFYNSTSVAQREQVFKKSKEEIEQIAVDGAKLVKKLAAEYEGNFRFEYSPESFTGTEPEYALEVCNAVLDVLEPSESNNVIINLPVTVEMSMPHIYANQIEWCSNHLKYRDSVILSTHPHNDRGCGIADTELGLLAGADRVEGTLFGNGERTGNVDIVTVALNMYSHGVEPNLDFSNLPELASIYERLTRMHVYERMPYSGQLVFAAFSGSHQDAIAKGMKWRDEKDPEHWNVPYLPIDPMDVGREYEGDVIRINSQSGKGGVAFVMDTYFGFKLPKAMHKEFANVIQKISEKQGEVSPQQIMDNFKREYLDQKEPLHFKKLRIEDLSGDVESGEFDTKVIVDYTLAGKPGTFDAVGNGPIDAVKRGLQLTFGMNIRVLDYEEHALQNGSNAQAAAYIHMMDAESGRVTYGVGVSSNITRASVRAMFSAVNRLELVTGV